MMLARIRKYAGLTHKDICSKTGWNKSFVSRLETASGAMPDSQTITRFADACGLRVGLLVYKPAEPRHVHIVDVVRLLTNDEKSPDNLEVLRNKDLLLA
jgi:transcriptional regulator with XRE-family HTH domain